MSSVLIVDDSSTDRALFRTILTRVGYTVHEVANGRDAVLKAREVRPHAIILDVNLGDTDGHTVCRAIRADPEVANVPVLMLTVRDNEDDILAGLDAGADDYVAKDSPGEIVLARVRRLVQYRQMTMVAVLNENLVQIGRLLAGIVHEIRGPLSVIRGSAELMRLQLSANDPHLQWIEPILRNAQLLQVRLEHLMATVRSGPAKVEDLDLAPVVREATDLFLKGTDPRGHHMAITADFADPLPPVRADAGQLIMLFLNLFGNAHEASSDAGRQGHITVRAFPFRDLDREWVKVEVADDGPGIPHAYLERIFEPHFTTKKSGSGFGLYLASQTLREQGGRLTVNNRSGGGACFTVWLAPAPSPETVVGAS
jgi:two-component system, sensor histidine kinase and response regulator